MEFLTVSLISMACLWNIASGNPTPPTRFQADKFLDMLGKSYDSSSAYVDLLSALHRRLNLDQVTQSNSSSSTADSGSSNFNAMAESAANCPEAPSRKGASVTYTSETRAVGSRALYQCDPGFNGRSKFISCGPGSLWASSNDWEGCIPLDCGPPSVSVSNSDASYNATTVGESVLYTCQSGFKMNSTNSSITCLPTGYWQLPSFYCEKSNTPPNVPGFPGMPNAGLSLAPSQLPSSSASLDNPMAAMFANMFPHLASPTPAMTPAPTTTLAPPVNIQQPNGFALPRHLQNLLPNGLSSTSGFRPQDLMTLTSLGLGSANPAAAPRDLSQLLGSMSPMSMFGGGLGLGSGGGAGAGPAVPYDPERAAEQREEMMMRAMMASAMKSMMMPSQGNSTNNHNPAMDMMALMALQNGISGGQGAGGMGAGGAGYDPMAMMLGGFGGGGAASPFGSLFGSA